MGLSKNDKNLLKEASKTELRLALHAAVRKQLERDGIAKTESSRIALRKMREQPWITVWQDFFTAVEIEGYSLPHKD